jgi:prevent-host-death family protein
MLVNIQEAKDRLSELIRLAEAGEEVIITNRGAPAARLIPADGLSKPPDSVGSVQAILGWLRSHPLPAYARRSAEEIDAAVRDQRASWPR